MMRYIVIPANCMACRLTVLATMLIGIATLSGCGEEQQAHAAQVQPAPAVSVAEVIAKPVTEMREFSGRLEAVESAQLRPRVSGYIDEVRLKPGTLVRKGDPLFVIDPQQYRTEVERLSASSAGTHVKLDLARRELVRSARLLSENAIAQRDYDDRSANVRQLEATARADDAALQAAKLKLDWTVVRAPFDGRVGKADVTAGNLVDSNTVLTTVVSDQPMYVVFEGDEHAYHQIVKVGRQNAKAVALHVSVTSEPGQHRPARLEFVDNRVDTNTGSVKMRALVDNQDHLLTTGLSAKVQLGVASTAGEAAVLIAERAVGTDQNRQYVYVLAAGNHAEYREVELGSMAEGLRVVRSGLKPGDRIVLDGLQRVRPGAVVDAKMVPMVSVPDAKIAQTTQTQ